MTSQPETDPQPQSKRFSPIVLIFLALPILGVIIALVMLSGERNLNQAEGIAVEQDFTTTGWQAADFALPALDTEGGDTTIQLSDLRGRVVFVNFWATDCVPCVRELPAFEAFMQEQDENGAVILAVNGAESAETINTFLDSIDVNRSAFPIALDRDLSVRQEYGVIALPTTFVIDAEGVVRSRKLGEITLQNLRDYVSQIS